MKPRARKFKKLWTYQNGHIQIVTRRAHFGDDRGYRLVYGLFEDRDSRTVHIVPLQFRQDEGFRYDHKALLSTVNAIVDDYLDEEKRARHYRDWEGEL